ncbi:MAG: enoyl-CoA hydratase-related protein [Beijerinckiaceae bacterium]
MQSFERITLTREDALLWIAIDRPHVLNALDPPAHRELDAALNLYRDDSTLRVAILTATGDKAFCAGSDIKARAQTNADDYPASGYGGLCNRFDLLKPVIAAVNGLALGGGAELVIACDLAYAADHATFSLPEPRVGLAALGGGGLQRLARHLPLKQAMELVLTSRRISAQEAVSIGLINGVVPAAQLQDHVRSLAAMIIANAPLALEASKQVMRDSLAMPDLRAALAADYPAAARMLASEDAIEGQRAFVEKRPPVWRGR